jgi:DeoR family glycerol-3-phosphate regulon repressor
MTATDRRERIALILAQSGYAGIADLADHLGVSEMTVRRDLDVLVEKGIIERAYGGAVARPAARMSRIDTIEPGLDERIRLNSDAKAEIGRAAADLITAGQTIALDIGSTALCLAHAIKGVDVRVFTNSLKIAMFLSAGTPRVYTVGGEISGSEPSIVGAMARRQIEAFRFDWLFLGASGIAEDGLYDYSIEDTEIKQALIERARRTVALIDSSKFDRLSVARVAPLSAIDILVSDRDPKGELAARLQDAGVDVLAARPERMRTA